MAPAAPACRHVGDNGKDVSEVRRNREQTDALLEALGFVLPDESLRGFDGHIYTIQEQIHILWVGYDALEEEQDAFEKSTDAQFDELERQIAALGKSSTPESTPVQALPATLRSMAEQDHLQEAEQQQQPEVQRAADCEASNMDLQCAHWFNVVSEMKRRLDANEQWPGTLAEDRRSLKNITAKLWGLLRHFSLPSALSGDGVPQWPTKTLLQVCHHHFRSEKRTNLIVGDLDGVPVQQQLDCAQRVMEAMKQQEDEEEESGGTAAAPSPPAEAQQNMGRVLRARHPAAAAGAAVAPRNAGARRSFQEAQHANDVAGRDGSPPRQRRRTGR